MLKPVEIQNKVLQVPIIQGGMGIGVSLSGLAKAVCKEGGMGVISAAMPGFREPDFEKDPVQANIRALQKEIRIVKAEVPNSFLGVNVMVASRHYETYVKASIEAGADAILSGAGLPLDLPKYVQNKALMAPIVSSARACRLICRRWDGHHQCAPDFVIVEGPQAGGHLGFKLPDLENDRCQSLEEIVAEVKKELEPFQEKYAKSIPVFAAGGIFSHEDIVHIMEAGADGVQIATRFIATWECDAHPAFKQMIIHAQKEDIGYVKSPAGFPGRAIQNAFVKSRQGQPNQKVDNCLGCMIPCHWQDTPYCITRALIRAVQGDTENGLFFTGTNAYKISEISDVKSVMNSLQGLGKETK